MRNAIPQLLSNALERGSWRDPGPDGLRTVFSAVADLSDLELFTDLDTMRNVSAQLGRADFVDDRNFCMVRSESSLTGPADLRLVHARALVVAAAITAGDDVFVVLDLVPGDQDPKVLVFDWNKQAPERWVAVGRLSEVLARLQQVLARTSE